MRSFILLIATIILSTTLQVVAQEPYALLFYNLENLFDTIDDPATDDHDMLPEADREWTQQRYEQKIADIARVIEDFSREHHYPALMALAEVENRKVLEDIAQYPSLRQANYAICHYDSPDSRGIDVALLYRADIFTLEASTPIKVPTTTHTRDMLLVRGRLQGQQLYIIIAHWPSRIGDKEFTQSQREICAHTARHTIDSLMLHSPDARIIIAGDLNSQPSDHTLRSILKTRPHNKELRDGELCNLTDDITQGTSQYERRWLHFDQIIVSQSLLTSDSLSLRKLPNRGYAERFVKEYMLDKRGFPRATYQSRRYTGGISDHLPIYTLLVVQ